MPILIDGHNLIGHLPGISLADQDDEAQLVMLLRRYAARKRSRRIIVVFDHGVYGHPHNLNGYGVQCHFAINPKDADKEMVRRMRAIQQPDKHDWQVVTSDRAVAHVAHTRGITVVASDVFADRLLHPPSPHDAHSTYAPRKKKPTEASRKLQESLIAKKASAPLSEKEIEEWLRLFGFDDEV